jgi:hypothetical protein
VPARISEVDDSREPSAARRKISRTPDNSEHEQSAKRSIETGDTGHEKAETKDLENVHVTKAARSAMRERAESGEERVKRFMRMKAVLIDAGEESLRRSGNEKKLEEAKEQPSVESTTHHEAPPPKEKETEKESKETQKAPFPKGSRSTN